MQALERAQTLKARLDESVVYLKSRIQKAPQIALFLGTGLGSLSSQMKDRVEIPYEAIPCFPKPSAFGQTNSVVVGDVVGKTVISFEGRFHAYEGHPFEEIGFPVRVANALGASSMVATNISGGINLSLKCGDLVCVEDHLNLMGGNPLVGAHEPWMGEKFLDLCEPYSMEYLKIAKEIFSTTDQSFKRGVYAAVLGPHLETRAEYRFLKTIGADLVGMSTVPEVLVARQLAMKVLVLSVVSDECNPDDLKPVSIPNLLKVAEQSQKPLTDFLTKFIARLEIV